jgi:predicted ATP-grasp superfamily ATP-dependent carboligase
MATSDATSRNGASVLVSGGEHIGVLAAVRALRDAGHRPWVAVHEAGAYAARSRAAAGVISVPDPSRDEKGFVCALADAAARIPVAVVLPGTEVELAVLSQHADRFPATVALGVCPPSIVSTATNKALFAQLAQSAGLSVPRTEEVSLSDRRRELPLRFPAVVKPLGSELRSDDRAIRHFVPRRVDSSEELRAALALFPAGRGLVQPYLPGPLGSIAGVFWKGEMIGAVQSSAQRIWPRHCGSMTYAVTVPLNQDLAALVDNLLVAIGWNGLFQIDFIEHAGRYYVIDLNPRIYTSLAITTRAGVNLPAIWVDLLRGRATSARHRYLSGVAYRHDEDDIRALVVMLIRGPRGAALRGLFPRLRTAHAVFAFRDPLPALTSLAKLRLAARTAIARRFGIGWMRGIAHTVVAATLWGY